MPQTLATKLTKTAEFALNAQKNRLGAGSYTLA
jgi:hypothetical protein